MTEEYLSNNAQCRLKQAQEDRQYLANMILTSPTIDIASFTANLRMLIAEERNIAELIKKEQKEYEEGERG